MVKPESYDLQSKRLARGILVQNTTWHGERLERAANGAWFIVGSVKFVFHLTDGRTVTVDKKLRLRGTQEGSRPNPNPFGRKRKKKA